MANKIANVSRKLSMDSIPTISASKGFPGHRSIVREFCLNTSTHGLPGVARAQSVHNRVFWSISFLAFLAIMMVFIVNTIRGYFEYPTNIDVSYETEWPQYFPAVSLCNLAPLRFDQFIEPFVNFTNAQNLTNINDTSTFSPLQAGLIFDFLVDETNNNQPLQRFSFSLSSMLRICSFNNQACSAADFITFKSATYGLCYTFNAKLKNHTDDSSVRYTNQYGGAGVLTLSLYVHSHQQVPYIVDATGVLLLVHDNTQIPRIETSGVELAPGMRYKLSYKKKRTDLLSSPYTSCRNKLTLAMVAMLENYDGADYTYSQPTCLMLCQQTYVYEKCGCISPYLWNARTIVAPGTSHTVLAPLCNTSDPCALNGIASLVADPSLLTQYCSDCSQDCSLISFPFQLSSSKGLFDWQIYEIKAFVENSSVPMPADWSTMWYEHIQQNYLTVNIITETNIVEKNTQTAAMTYVDVISNIGGQTGLWIGLSFLSFMEFIEMIYRLIRHFCR